MRRQLIGLLVCLTATAVLQGTAVAAPAPRGSARAGYPAYLVTHAGVVYRTGPGTHYHELGVLRLHGVIAGTGHTSAGWIQFFLPSRPTAAAWVYGGYVAHGNFPVYRVVALDGVNLHSGPGLRYRVVGTLPHGVIIAGPGHETEGWVELDLPGSAVWASGRYLAPAANLLGAPLEPLGPLDPVHRHDVCRVSRPAAC